MKKELAINSFEDDLLKEIESKDSVFYCLILLDEYSHEKTKGSLDYDTIKRCKLIITKKYFPDSFVTDFEKTVMEHCRKLADWNYPISDFVDYFLENREI